MNHLRKAAALAAAGALCLFAACGSLSLTPAAPTASPQPDMDAAAQARGGTLRLWLDEELEGARTAFDAYGQARGVTIEPADTADKADLALLAAPPKDGQGWQEPENLTLLPDLLAAQKLTAQNDAVPLGGAAWGYWAEKSTLTALLGSEFDPEDLRQASWKEWTAFAAAVEDWLAQPSARCVTLNGKAVTLPESRPAQLEGLSGVFAPAGEEGVIALYSPAAAAGGSLSQAAGAVYDLLELEAAHTAPGQGVGAVAGGTALFARAGSVQAAQLADPVLLPCKMPLTAANGTPTTQQLLAWPTAGTGAWAAIPTNGDAAQGEAALLWLYTSAAGRSALSAAGLAPITGAGTGAGGLAAERITSGECLAAAAVPEAAREALRTRPEPKAAFSAAFAG